MYHVLLSTVHYTQRGCRHQHYGRDCCGDSMLGLVEWTNTSGGTLLVTLAVIAGGLVTWRLLSRARNTTEEKTDPAPSTSETRSFSTNGGKRKKRRRGSGGAGQQPRSQRKKRGRGNSSPSKDGSDRERDSGTQDSNSSDSDRLQQDGDRQPIAIVDRSSRSKREEAREIVKEGSSLTSDLSSHGRPVESIDTCEQPSLGEQDRSVTLTQDDRPRGVSPIEQTDISTPASVTDTLATSTFGFVEDHFEIEEQIDLRDHTQDEREKELETSEGAEALLRSLLVKERVVSQITTTLTQEADATLTSTDTTSDEEPNLTRIPAEEEKAIPQLRDAATSTEDKKEEEKEEEEEEEEDDEEIVVLERESIETEEQTSEKQEEEEEEEEAEILDNEEDEEGWVVL